MAAARMGPSAQDDGDDDWAIPPRVGRLPADGSSTRLVRQHRRRTGVGRLYNRSGHREDAPMINGAHVILYSHDADATRAALAKVLGTRSVDAGGGWLIFALPRPRLPSIWPRRVAGPSCTCCVTTSRPPRPPCSPRGSRLPGRLVTRAGACRRPSPFPAGSSSAFTSRATRPRPSRAERTAVRGQPARAGLILLL